MPATKTPTIARSSEYASTASLAHDALVPPFPLQWASTSMESCRPRLSCRRSKLLSFTVSASADPRQTQRNLGHAQAMRPADGFHVEIQIAKEIQHGPRRLGFSWITSTFWFWLLRLLI